MKPDVITSLPHKGLLINHLNIRSLLPKLDEIKHTVFSQNIDILCLNETFLDNTITDHEMGINGYTSLRKDRTRHGGGVAMYIKDTINFKCRDDIPSNFSLECLWIEISGKDSESILLCSIYRPPSADHTYYSNIIDMLMKASSENKHLVVIGDMNFNYVLDEELYKNPIHFIEKCFGMHQLVNKPTRKTHSSSTLIDIILTTRPQLHTKTSVLPITMSDHYMISTLLIYPSSMHRNHHKTIRMRDYKNFNVNLYLHDLHELCNINNYLGINNVNVFWDKLKRDLLNIAEQHAPIQIRRVKHRQNHWITPEIIKCMHERDYLHHKATSTKNQQTWKDYQCIRNKVTNLIRQSKLDYFNSIAMQTSGKNRQFWKDIQLLMPPKKNESSPNISSEQFNNHFSTIGEKVCAPFINQVENKVINSPESVYTFQIKHISTIATEELFSKLSDTSSMDVFDMDCKLLKIGYKFLAPLLAHLFNLSVTTACYPDDWKLARVTPIYKNKGSKDDVLNYRPISVTCYISKLMEYHIQQQLAAYLHDHNFITPDQFAFIKHHSTSTCLHKLIDNCLQNIDDKQLTGLCFLDIQKCFDTINHTILLKKLAHYGIKNNELMWFTSYLTNRRQCVRMNNSTSGIKSVNIGVPQGSVLGPILFLVYINDISQNIHLAQCNIFADDVILYTTGKTLREVNDKLQLAVDEASIWYTQNKLMVNAKKSNTMLIHSRNVTPGPLNLKIQDKEIEHSNSVKY